MPSIIGLMTHKANNLRTIESAVKTTLVAPANYILRDQLLNYIRNLRIILTCLLDSIHDFKAGPSMRGNKGYINHIINNLIDYFNNNILSPDVSNLKLDIIEWITQWNTNPARFPPNPATSSLTPGTGSILNFIQNAKGDNVEYFVALLLDVESVTLNRFDNGTPQPQVFNPIHDNAIAVVNDFAQRKHQCPLFFDSLWEAARVHYNTAANDLFAAATTTGNAALTLALATHPQFSFKFFTIRDHGFVSSIFYNRDANANPIANSKTDTIFSSPGLWDNGAKHGQSVDNDIGNSQTLGVEPLDLISNNIIHEQNAATTMININDHADGGVLGFRYIRTYVPPNPAGGQHLLTNPINGGGVYFGNTIYLAAGGGVYNVRDYDTFMSFDNIKAIDKNLIKGVIKELMANSNITISCLDTYKNAIKHFFKAAAPVNVNGHTNGWRILKVALSQSGTAKNKNAKMILGCILDLKRSGDFMQSASVKSHKDNYDSMIAAAASAAIISEATTAAATSPAAAAGRQAALAKVTGQTYKEGIFATNDRIAGYISAKIHGNYTMLSSPTTPLTMLTLWNGFSKTQQTGHNGYPVVIHQLKKKKEKFINNWRMQ